jgi:flagellar biosynthesis/type III secretory pathway protein FliH
MGVLGVQTQHDYRRCRDEDCQRYACRIYREGYANGKAAGNAEGHAAGLAEGYSKGHAEGYSQGYADGAANCRDR